MAKGKLLAVGTTEFIKKNFGIGYHLSVFEDPDHKVEGFKFNEKI